MAHIARKAIKVAVGPDGGNRVAHMVERDALVPDGVPEDVLARLERRGLIEKVQVDPDGPRKPGGNAGADKWKAYAEQIGVQVPAEAEKDRDVIKALIEAHEAANATT